MVGSQKGEFSFSPFRHSLPQLELELAMVRPRVGLAGKRPSSQNRYVSSLPSGISVSSFIISFAHLSTAQSQHELLNDFSILETSRYVRRGDLSKRRSSWRRRFAQSNRHYLCRDPTFLDLQRSESCWNVRRFRRSIHGSRILRDHHFDHSHLPPISNLTETKRFLYGY